MVSLHRHHGLAPLSLGPGHFWLALVGHFSFAPKNAGTTPEDHSDFATNDAMALGVIRAVQEATESSGRSLAGRVRRYRRGGDRESAADHYLGAQI